MTIAEEVRGLEELRDSGSISEHEFQKARHRLLHGGPLNAIDGGQVHGVPEDTWCMMMHLSQLLVFAGGVGIFVAPVLWLISRDQSDLARRHGARMMNWLCSNLIYTVVSAVLLIVGIGFILLPILLILDVVFPVLAAVNAGNQKLWSYPLSIRFFRED